MFRIETLGTFYDEGSIKQGYFFFLKQCSYCTNTVTFSKFRVGWCDLPPPPTNTVRVNTRFSFLPYLRDGIVQNRTK